MVALFHAFIVFVVLSGIFYRYRIGVRYIIPLGVAIWVFYYSRGTIIKSELDTFVGEVEQYREYNPQLYHQLVEDVQQYNFTRDGTNVLNTFHDFIHTLPSNMAMRHRGLMRKLETLVDRPLQLNDAVNPFRYYV